MIIQVQFENENQTENDQELSAHIDATIKRATSHFRDRITSVAVHLNKKHIVSDNNKRCTLETKLEGLQPIVTSYNSESFDHAVEGAAATLKATLAKDFGHHKQH